MTLYEAGQYEGRKPTDSELYLYNKMNIYPGEDCFVDILHLDRSRKKRSGFPIRCTLLYAEQKRAVIRVYGGDYTRWVSRTIIMKEKP